MKRTAGGWGALKASAVAMVRERAFLKGSRALLKVNRDGGFDCPGCAWPDPAHTAHLEFCENGLKAVAAEATSKRVTAQFFASHPVAELYQKDDFWLEQQGRLCEPVRYNSKKDLYEPVTWEKAFSTIGEALQKLSHPGEALFYTSGRTSNEAAFLYQLFARAFGTNNLPDCSNMCHESSGVALTESIGVGKGTVTLDDFDKCDAIFIMGQNPGTNHPRMLLTLENARKRGVEIVVFNPLVEAGLVSFIHPKKLMSMITGRAASIASLYLQPLIGGDLAALKGLCKWVVESGKIDHAFLRDHTVGYDGFERDIRAVSWELIEQESGLNRDSLKKAAEIYLKSERVITCWAMGLTQHTKAVATIQYVVNFMLLQGNIGRPGAGLCPVRGHSNVQGDRTMGITEKPDPRFLERLGNTFDFTPPPHHGLDTVEAIKAMASGSAKVFIGLGGNFAAATPDRIFTERALKNCALTVHVSTKLNRSHLVTGGEALILPCLARSERDLQGGRPQQVTVEDSMSMVHASQGRNSPAGRRLLSEVAIVAGMARAALPHSKILWEKLCSDYHLIREKIAAVIPGFEDYNKKILQPGGFQLRNAAAHREWKNPSGRAEFKIHSIEPIRLREGELRLMTIRSHDQFNTTIYGLDDRYRGIRGERRVVFVNLQDMEVRRLMPGQRVNLESTDASGSVRRAESFRVVPYNLPAGCAAAYFPEANALVSIESVAEKSNTPASKLIPVILRSV